MNDLPFYPLPHEPPKAFSAFLAWLDSGDRCCAKIAATAGVSTSTIQTWSRRFDWGGRAAAYNTQILRGRLEVDLKASQDKAQLWRQRTEQLKESEWKAHESLIAAARRILHDIRAQDPHDLRPGDAARLIEVASKLGRIACGLNPGKPEPLEETPAQDPFRQFAEDLERVYGEKACEDRLKRAELKQLNAQPVSSISLAKVDQPITN